jgi:hypothetical protein
MLHGVSMQIGYNAPHNEDCLVRGNVIVGGGLSIVRYKRAVRSDNTILPANAKIPSKTPPIIIVRANKYDAARAHVAIYNWTGADVRLDAKQLKGFLKPREAYRLIDPRNFYGKAVQIGAYDGKSITIAMKNRMFAAFVLVKLVPAAAGPDTHQTPPRE